MCEHHVYHSDYAPVTHSGCCCGPTVSGPGVPSGRHFPTREERIAQLEAYVQGLEQEAAAVKGRIAALKTAE